MMLDTAIIFAAGFGTRMGAMTANTPKPLIPVAGRPLIDYALDITVSAEISNTVINLHYLHEKLEDYLVNRRNIQTIVEQPNILETGGGLKNALPQLGSGPVFTLNSDAIWSGTNPLITLRNHWKPNVMDALLLLLPIDAAQEHRGSGDFYLSDQNLIERKGAQKFAPYVYSGAQIIKTDLLHDIIEESFSLNILWDQMIKKGRAFGVIHTGGWVDVGRPEGILIAENEVEKYV